jgi:hypothetical protein
MPSPSDAAGRVRLALELYAAGEEMMRQRLRREHPDASHEEIETMLASWLSERPGADHGDADGRPAAWPRHAR